MTATKTSLCSVAAGALMAGLLAAGSLPQLAGVREFTSEWLGGNSVPDRPVRVTEILLDGPAPGTVSSIEAGMVLRAAERFAPAAVVFLDPVADDAGRPVLESRLRGYPVPVVFTGLAGAPALQGVRAPRASAPQEGGPPPPAGAFVGAGPPTELAPGVAALVFSNGEETVAGNLLAATMVAGRISALRVEGAAPGKIKFPGGWWPVAADGSARINRSANDLVDSVGFGELMLRVEQAERGIHSPLLDRWFRGRAVAVRQAGSAGNTGSALAAAQNGLFETASPPWIGALLALICATVPWWARQRGERAVWALLASVAWCLLAIGVYGEFRVVPPVWQCAALPLVALAVPPRKSREMPR